MEECPASVEAEVAGIEGIPLYDGDYESVHGIPAPVSDLKDRVATANGLVLVTPEYNQSIPGVFKNAIDWLSRPPDDIARVFGDRPVALMGATPGGMGTSAAQLAWLPVLRALGTRPWYGQSFMISRAHAVFDEQGRLADVGQRERLRGFLREFAEFVVRR